MSCSCTNPTVCAAGTPERAEKYKELEKSDEKSEYWAKKKLDQEAAQKCAKEKEKAKKQQKRLDKVNHYRAIAGQKPLNPSQLNKKSKK